MSRRLHRTYRPLLAIVAVGALLVGAATPCAPPLPASEYEIKAAYLYNFGRFVEWPASTSSNQDNQFAICVLGSDPFGSALDTTIAGEKINSMKVVAGRISHAADAANCRILFIGSSEEKQLKDTLSTMSRMGVLTVSDLPHFVQQGGMVQFLLADKRVRFAINLAAAREAGLNLSSELLKVAAEVRGKS